jgi:uncharacterized protein (TIGR02246 family)
MTATEPDTVDVRARIDWLEAVEAIRRVVHRYFHTFDKRHADGFAAIWTTDAVWSAGPGHQVTGRHEIRQAAEAMWGQFGATHHWSSNALVDVDGERATAVVDLHAFAQGSDGTWTQTAATYRDEFRRTSGVWLLARRETDIHHTFAVSDPIN